MIQHTKITVETVTPLFMGGSDPQGIAEVRPTSIRGGLHWWLRALLAADGKVALKEVHRREAEVFGETERASSIIVRVQGAPEARQDFVRPERSALNYLWYGLHQRVGQGKALQIRYRSVFLPGEQFAVRLQTRPTSRDLGREFEQVCRAFWLLTALGGLGSRSRRGAGVLVARAVGGEWPSTVPDLYLGEATAARALAGILADGLRKLHGPKQDEYSNKPLPYANLRPDRYELVLFDKEWDDWEEALTELGEAFRSFRSRYSPDYETVKRFIISGEVGQTVERAAFGLPLPFYYRSLGGGKATIQGKGFDRAASPLHFRLWPLQDGRVAAGFLLFRAPLLPPRDGKLLLRGPRGAAEAPMPSQKPIIAFLSATESPGSESYIAPLLEVKL